MPTVGIPRALLYYYYYPMWKTFFQELGARVVLSGKTSKTALDEGVRHVVDDACLPVKLAFGHVQELKSKVDYLFLPRIVSVARDEYICPKFLGFPDMVKQNIGGLPTVINMTVNLHRGAGQFLNEVYRVGRHFTKNPLRILAAHRKSCLAQKQYQGLLESGMWPDEAVSGLFKNCKDNKSEHGDQGLSVAVIGHPYNVYDSYINMNLLKRLRDMGATVYTADNIPEAVVRKQAGWLPKRLFWSLGQRMTGAAAYYLGEGKIDGIVHLSAFGCGPDSLIGELIERHARRQGRVPFLNLMLDEHTGEAGIVTRLEAFIDMVKWRGAQA